MPLHRNSLLVTLVLAVFLSSAATDPVATAASGTPTLGQADFQYAGYYMVPNGGSFSELNYGEGFTHRYVNGQLRFLTMSFYGNTPSGGHQLIEFAPPSAVGGTVGGITNHWGDIFPGPAAGVKGDYYGLWYDQAKNRLWTTSAIDYPDDVQAQYTRAIVTRTLNDDGTVSDVKGYWGLEGVQQRRIYGGVTAIPQWFQDQYNVGPYGVGWGGYASRMMLGTSMGPTFYAIPDPANYASLTDIPTSDFKTLMDHGSGTRATDWYADGQPTTFDRGVRNSDVDNTYDYNTWWKSPAPDGLGRWVWGDSAYNTGNWIETPSRQGFVIVPKFSSGETAYARGMLNCERQTAEIQVFDPNMLGQVAQGTRQVWDTPPADRWDITADMTPLGLGHGIEGDRPVGGPGGATYDPLTRTLYVYCMWGTNLNSYILMYKIDAHPGDANGDNAVDVIDLGILATNYDQIGKTIDTGDFNQDGSVDVIDLGILATNYDWVAPGSVSIPEPTSLSPLALAAAALIRRQRR